MFGTKPEYAVQCQAILDNSTSPYAHHLASSSLLKLVTEQGLGGPLRLDIRNYILNYLASNGPKLARFVSTALVQLLCRITKLSWFDDDAHRTIVEDAKKFLQPGSPDHYVMGLRIFNMLVAEMNQPIPRRSLTQHRKTAVSFRDNALFAVFQTALAAIREVARDRPDSLEEQEQAIALALKCVSFDFVGTSLDESSEDLGTIQVPSAWRSTIEDPATMQLFFDVYAATGPPLSSQAVECLVKLACVRRSLFVGERERTLFLNHLINGTRTILLTKQGLDQHANYHEFCRLLGRLKTNYQLVELVNVENYADWVQRVAEFTITSLQSWQWAGSSVYYLLSLWSRLVSSVPYLKGDSPSMLENYVPKITESYITSRLESVQLCLQDAGVEDMLENDEQLQDQFDALPYMCRFRYEESCTFICSVLDPAMNAFTQCAALQPGADTSQLRLLEGQLTWLVYIVGAIVRGRNSFSSAESQEVIDGELAARVFNLIKHLDTGYHTQRYGERSRQRLDLAVLMFCQHFRKVYIGEQAIHQSKVYGPLKEKVGINDHLMVLDVVVSKIATDLRVYPHCVEVINDTLALFLDLAQGFMSGKHLLKLNAVNYVLQHHTREHFPFLDDPACSRNRTTFYYTLGSLIFLEADSAAARFKAFIVPLQTTMEALAQQAADPAAFRSEPVKRALIGLFRDLRGLVTATNVKRTYIMVFDWLYPEHMGLFLRTLEAYADVPAVTTPLLKFVAELVLNKNQRLTFDYSSPNGIKLFWEVSKILCEYGKRTLELPAAGDLYANKYKGTWVCFLAFYRTLAGNYVNFGVFELYGDPSLQNALTVTLRMALSIPLTDTLAYRKLAKAYFQLMEILTLKHTVFLAQQDTPTFVQVSGRHPPEPPPSPPRNPRGRRRTAQQRPAMRPGGWLTPPSPPPRCHSS